MVYGSANWDLELISVFRVQQLLTEYLMSTCTSQSIGEGRVDKM